MSTFIFPSVFSVTQALITLTGSGLSFRFSISVSNAEKRRKKSYKDEFYKNLLKYKTFPTMTLN